MYTKNKLDGIGVVIGRFQTPYLHEGHKSILDTANEHSKLLVLVGVHNIPGAYGEELDFDTRRLMLQRDYRNAVILPIKNCRSDEMWSKNVDNLIYTVAPFSKVTLYHGRDSFAPHYHGIHNLKEVDSIKGIEATDIRRTTCQKTLESLKFRSGVFYGLQNTFPRVNPTVDIAITRKNQQTGKKELLLGKKKGENFWRFPGGFVDTTDPSAEEAAKREALEETGLYLDNAEYITSRQVADWRSTQRNIILTFFYHFEYTMGHAKAADDLEQIEWFELDNDNLKLKNNINIVDEHQALLTKFFLFYSKKHKKAKVLND